MGTELQKRSIPPRLTFRRLYADGRATALLTLPDGQWKIEVFASLDHAMQFAKENGYEITNSPERE